MEPVAGSTAGSDPLNLLFSIFFMRFSCWMEPIWALLPESLHRILLFFCEDGAHLALLPEVSIGCDYISVRM